MTLSGAKRGQHVKIIHIPDENIRSQAIRFGIGEGVVVLCEEILPAGPIVLRKNRQEIAIGRELANRITVTLN